MGAPRFLRPRTRLRAFRTGLVKLGGAMLLMVFGLAVSRPPPAGARLALLGDLMLGRGVAVRLSDLESEPLVFLSDELQAADLALGNLESPLTDEPLRDPAGYDLRANPAAAIGLAASGLDALSLANNHSLDSGPAGLADTRVALARAGLAGLASGDPPLRFELDGLKLSLLAYEGVNQPLDLAAIEADIRREKARGALVIVSLHWGAEFRPAPEPWQVDAADVLAQAGADLIWGHHPHVLQPVKWLERPGFRRPSLVVYSLGNALFDQQTPPDVRWGALLSFTLDGEGVKSVNARPFEIDLRQAGLQEASADTAVKIFERLQLPPVLAGSQ